MDITLSGDKKAILRIAFVCLLLAITTVLSSCGGTGGDSKGDDLADAPFASREIADLSDCEGMDGYEGETRFIETDVAEVVKLMDKGETFAVFLGFADCPFCNSVISYVNEAAEDAGQYVGYIDTRKDPSWVNNTDIVDYDLFVETFGEYLDEGEDGKKHLYVPDMYFIKDGKVVARHYGVVEGADDPQRPLTADQEKKLREILAEDFAKLTAK